MDQNRDNEIAALRAFNRAYTARTGLLNTHLDQSPFSLSEARVLYEIAHRTDPTAAEIGRALGLDRAQISRTLKRFAERGLVETRDHPSDARNLIISLTSDGQEAFAALEGNTRAAVGALLDGFPPIRRARLLEAARTISKIVEADDEPALILRDPEPGDLGYILYRQSALYAQEYGWNGEYEVLVTKILAQFHQTFDPTMEAAWVAELDGQIVGSIFLVKGDTTGVAKLRLLYVEPDARGSGVASKLVEACIQRARDAGYTRLDLWTNSVLTAARRIYERAGFKLVDEAPHHSFGKDLVGQTFSLNL
ncbi:helix-turn-helix domain-containing GNAT family N-acetyltransferase [Rhizobium sp. BK376]|uniref:bifunctional helix-turn-helix transcriptional regulator/GNAT family N-acetyltransferase n=1 Tax=Rhizobium sp. BK376 TaxID=2512149 RepID=UPI001047266C|nr:helix-turn-helix domain-containing GNAT family N-acetyltransferase [Rhizobium sp. BK376]TCR80867.1 MarR family transcriptional regulator with acetyltransferase activity [Rhizobium sp. BK376]